MQSDLFQTSPAIVGLPVDVRHWGRRCHDNVATIHPGKGPHAGELLCAMCGAHRGWLSKATGEWVAEVVQRFGPPTKALVFRHRGRP